MSFLSWLRNWKSSVSQGCRPILRPACKAATFRPRLESLEERCLLSFGSPLSIPAAQPSAIVAADLTGNGKSDLVLGGISGVEVLMSQKGGPFKAAFFQTNYAVNAVAVGDVNHDGKADIVLAENPGDSAFFGVPGVVSVLLGNGKGGFTAPVDFFPSAPTDSVALADLNGDGLLDIVTDNSVLLNSSYQISVINQGGFGNNNGGDWGQTYDFPGSGGNGMALGDLNGDGRPEIVTMSGANAIQVWLNNGAGGFTAGQTFGGRSYNPVPLGDNAVALGDVNGDGKLDIVTANGASNTVSVFAGNGNGTVNPTAQNYAVGGAAYAIVLGDFNKDGKLDIATTGAQMNVLLNNGSGAFGTALAVGPAGSQVVVGDFNGDAFPDLAQIDASRAGIDVLLNKADWQTTGNKKH
jgi:hypothetical protein